MIADLGDCTLHEGFVNSCKIGNFELGSILYTTFVAGWLLLVSIPLSLLGSILGSILFVARIIYNFSLLFSTVMNDENLWLDKPKQM